VKTIEKRKTKRDHNRRPGKKQTSLKKNLARVKERELLKGTIQNNSKNQICGLKLYMFGKCIGIGKLC